MTSWLHQFKTTDDLIHTLNEMGCDGGCLPYFNDKREIFSLRIADVDTRAANALKQEMLSRGGDVAVHRHAIDHGIDQCDCIIFGTVKQIRHLEEKIRAMPYWGLDAIREELHQVLDNLRRQRHSLKLPRDRRIVLGDSTKLMAIVNLTEDSFYDGSRVYSSSECLKRVESMISEGADILDLGAESTRPGSLPATAELEISRLVPALEDIRREFPDIPISIDTTKSEVSHACLESGADIINDISGLGFDTKLPEVVAKAGVPLVLMHIKGVPKDMHVDPSYENLPREICRFFEERLAIAESAGIERGQIILDPGLGFGKTAEHNLTLLQHSEFFRTFGLPILIGHSRKGTIGKVLGLKDPQERLEGTLAITSLCAWQGIEIVRVHDVQANRRVLDMINAVKNPDRFC